MFPQTPHTGDFPKRVTLELTNRCNISCTFCPRHSMGGGQGLMPTDTALRLIDEMSEHPPLCLVPFFRGEALLHPDWHKILAYAVRRGLAPVQFTTNAMLLSPENAALLLDTGIQFISFSLDTLDPTLYEASRRKADFRRTMDNVHAFLRLRDERAHPIQVQVSVVETEAHKPGMEAFVNYWLPLVDRVRVYAEHSTDGSPGSLEHMELSEQRLPCKKLYSDMIVYWNGEVGICNHDWKRPAEGPFIGNAAEHGIARIWHNETYELLRRAHEEGTSLAPPCAACGHWAVARLPERLIGRLYTNSTRQDM